MKAGTRITVVTALLQCVTTVLVILSCSGTGTEPTSRDRDALVVQATLYAERPVNDVRVLHMTKAIHDTMIQYETWDEISEDYVMIDTVVSIVRDSIVDDARITISSNGISYNLDHRDSGRYQQTGGDLMITAGETYRIDVIADGRHAWAKTTVPRTITDLVVSMDTIHVPPDDPMEFTEALIEQLSVKWSNPDGGHYYYKIIYESDTPDNGTWIGRYTGNDSITVDVATYMSELLTANDRAAYVRYPAKYKFILYATTPDYRSMLAELADTTRQDRWTSSPTNINGGLGFFAAFSIDSIYFNVAE